MLYLPPGRYHEYYRISQDQSGNAVGTTRQQNELRPIIDGSPGVESVDKYIDPDVSATKENVIRPEFERLLKAVKPGEHVICWHGDRFLRTTRDLMRVIKAEILVHSLHSGITDLSTPAGIATAKTQVAWAEYEGQQKAIRQKSSHRERAANGRPFLGGSRPFGFDPAWERVEGFHKPLSTYEIRESEAVKIRQAYDLLIAGAKTSHIAAQLNDEGCRTSKGALWTHNNVRLLLLHPRNVGKVTYHGEVVATGCWLPIIDQAKYDLAVRILTDPSRFSGGPRMGRGGVLHYLVGVAQCAICHGPARAQRQSEEYTIYKCRNGHASARAEWLEKRAGALIVARVKDPLAEREFEGGPDLDELRAEEKRLIEKGEEIDDAYDNDEMPLARHQKLSDKNDAKLAAVRKAIGKAVHDDALHELYEIDDLETHWRDVLNARQRATYARAFFQKIEILPRGRAESGTCHGRARFWLKGAAKPIEV